MPKNSLAFGYLQRDHQTPGFLNGGAKEDFATTHSSPANGLDALSVVSPCCLASCSSFNTLLVLFCYPTRVASTKTASKLFPRSRSRSRTALPSGRRQDPRSKRRRRRWLCCAPLHAWTTTQTPSDVAGFLCFVFLGWGHLAVAQKTGTKVEPW